MIGYLVTVSELDAAEVPDEVKKQQFMVEVEDAVNNYAIPTAFSRYAAYMNIPLGK